jgi:hypothetical protein
MESSESRVGRVLRELSIAHLDGKRDHFSWHERGNSTPGIQSDFHAL